MAAPATAATSAVEMAVIRPYASVVITGIEPADPVVTAPGPTGVMLIAVPLMVKFPAPLDVETTRVPLSYTPCAYTVLATAVLPPMLTRPAIPTPPLTSNAPSEVLDDAVVALIHTLPEVSTNTAVVAVIVPVGTVNISK